MVAATLEKFADLAKGFEGRTGITKLNSVHLLVPGDRIHLNATQLPGGQQPPLRRIGRPHEAPFENKALKCRVHSLLQIGA